MNQQKLPALPAMAKNRPPKRGNSQGRVAGNHGSSRKHHRGNTATRGDEEVSVDHHSLAAERARNEAFGGKISVGSDGNGMGQESEDDVASQSGADADASKRQRLAANRQHRASMAASQQSALRMSGMASRDGSNAAAALGITDLVSGMTQEEIRALLQEGASARMRREGAAPHTGISSGQR